MDKNKNLSIDDQNGKKKKLKVIIRADKVRVRLSSGIIVYKYRDDEIKNPWPELLKMAATPSGKRIFAVIES